MFTKRITKPTKGDKLYITRDAGGLSWCIKGVPTDVNCNVLANCVGYACGRFNEIFNEITKNVSMKFFALNCNAENFIERALSMGLTISNEPVKGGIMVWQKGATLSKEDGAGHVAVVEDIIDKDTIYLSESGYKSSAFWNSTRKRGNGSWGAGKDYSFRGCIVNPAVKEEPKPIPVEPVVPNVPEVVIAPSEPVTPIKPIIPAGPAFKVGQKVKIAIKTAGYAASADGTGQGAKRYKAANGWVRIVLAYHKGKPFPYQVGLGNQTTGFFKEEDLNRI